ncbi:MAG: inorganic phosphate transporter, partial [Proteobacteria bacterium]|nr:inorganic phosphate transporter [Pseudomonadota bacterium]
TKLRLAIADENECVDLYTDKVWHVSIQKMLDAAHIVSAAAVSFARGLNDTPKIAGLLVATQAINIKWGMVVIAVGMAIGGLLSARRVAETISNKITEINHGQGFSANLVTSFLVIVASNFGVPVSTTHVSVGSIFGIGVVNKNRNSRMIRSILLSWLITLPVAMVFSASIYWLVT